MTGDFALRGSTDRYYRLVRTLGRTGGFPGPVNSPVGCTGRAVRPRRTAVAQKCSSVSSSTVKFSRGDHRTGSYGGSVSSVKSTGEFTGRALKSIRSVGSAPRKNFTVELDTDEQVPTGGPVRGPSHRYERDRRGTDETVAPVPLAQI